MKYIQIILLPLYVLLVINSSCNKKAAPAANSQVFVKDPVSVPIAAGIVNEASGIADSKSHPGHLGLRRIVAIRLN
jgi:hypothetical protein